jgi:hypothetical protein
MQSSLAYLLKTLLTLALFSHRKLVFNLSHLMYWLISWLIYCLTPELTHYLAWTPRSHGRGEGVWSYFNTNYLHGKCSLNLNTGSSLSFFFFLTTIVEINPILNSVSPKEFDKEMFRKLLTPFPGLSSPLSYDFLLRVWICKYSDRAPWRKDSARKNSPGQGNHGPSHLWKFHISFKTLLPHFSPTWKVALSHVEHAY